MHYGTLYFLSLQEEGRVTFEDLLRHSNAISMPVLQSDGLAASLTNHGRLLLPPWSRLPGQSCIVPDKACVKLPAGDMGGTALAFSRSGRLVGLADCAHTHVHTYIRIYIYIHITYTHMCVYTHYGSEH